MSSADVDWAEVERRSVRTSWLALPLMVLFLVALALLRGGEFGVWSGGAAWWAVGVLSAVAAVPQLLVRVAPGMRRRQAVAARIQHALRCHLDPGPELRTRIDVQARYLSKLSWVTWVVPMGALGLLVGARWDRPATTIPAAVALVVFFLAISVNVRRQTRRARRWVADPPGPPRDVPPPRRWERLATSPKVFVAVLAVLLLPALVLGLVVGLSR